MTRLIRIASIFLILIVLGVAAWFAGFWALQRALSTEKMVELIEKGASDFLHRPLTIERLDRPGFPLTELVAHNVTLKETSGEVIVTCPEVRARASLLSLLKLSIGVDELVFRDAHIHLRFHRNGLTNVERIVADIQDDPPTPIHRSIGALAFNKFVIERASVTVSDPRGDEIASARSVANGNIAIKLSPMGVTWLYALEVDGGEGRMRFRVTGRFGPASPGDFVFERLPAALLAPRFPGLAGCAGTTDGLFAWSGDQTAAVSFALSPSHLCGGAGPLPDRLSGIASRRAGDWAVSLDGLGAGTEAHLVGTIPAAKAPIVWTLTAPKLDVREAAGWVSSLQALDASSETVSALPVRPMSFSAHVSTFTVGALTFTETSAEVRRSTDGVVRFDPVIGTLFGGPVKGSGLFSSGTVTMDATADGIDLGRAARTFQSTSPLTGLLAVHLRGNAPASNLLYGFAGDVSLTLTDGRIPEVPTVLKALTSANLVKLEDDLKGEKSEGIAITQGNADAGISGGVANVSHLLLDSRVLRIGYTGKVDFVAAKVNGTVVLQPLNLADQIINDIPVLRTLILGDSKTFLPLWFAVKGPWGDPRVRSMPTKSLEAPVKNLLEGILKFPQRAFNAIRGKK